ncbi:hypothetical protein OSTOST_25141 [Ostertagia ostertagi]
MFLVLAAVLSVIVNAGVKVRPWPMPPYLENIYKEFFLLLIETWEYPLWNNLTMADKLFYTLLPYGIYRSEIEKLPKGVQVWMQPSLWYTSEGLAPAYFVLLPNHPNKMILLPFDDLF